MPCPYFYPVEPLVWPSAPKLPLGDAYRGLCQVDPTHPTDPGAAAQRDFCNLGYAGGRCERFPRGDGPDAVRFCAVQDSGGVIRISWARERDHYPFDQGLLDYSIEIERFTTAPVDSIVMQQAQAYVASYLRRKTRVRRES